MYAKYSEFQYSQTCSNNNDKGDACYCIQNKIVFLLCIGSRRAG